MRTRHTFPVSAAAAAAAAVATLLSACSPAQDPATEPAPEPATEPVTSVTSRPPEETTPSAAPRDPATVFADVLANPASVPVNPGAQYEPTGTYSYAFTDFTGDGEQDMLLRVDSEEFSPVIPIRANGQGGYVASTQVLLDGATSQGARSTVLTSDGGDGVYEQATRRDGPGSTTTHWRMEGDTLAHVGETAHEPGIGIPGATEVAWLDTATGEPARRETAVPAPPAAEDHPRVTGTLTFMTNEEMMRGEPMPNGEIPSNKLMVLKLDRPQPLTGRLADSTPVTNEAWLVTFGRGTEPATDWKVMDGQRVTIVYDEESLVFPTDQSIPVGQPKVHRIFDVLPAQ